MSRVFFAFFTKISPSSRGRVLFGGNLWYAFRQKIKQGVSDTSYFTYETDITYDELGPDQRLSRRGLVKILQEAAAIASDERGFGMKDIPRSGVFWLLAGWRLELRERPAWRSRLTVQTWPRSMNGFQSERDFLVYCGGELIARASSRWLLVNTSTGKVARVTDEVRNAYELDDRVLFEEPIPSNGKTPDGAPVTFSTTIGRRARQHHPLSGVRPGGPAGGGVPEFAQYRGYHLPPPDPAGYADPMSLRRDGGWKASGGDPQRGGGAHRSSRICVVLLTDPVPA